MPVTLPDTIYAIGRGLRGGVVDPVFAIGGSLYARLRDGAGNNLTSTAVGAQRALDVNIAAGAGAGGTSMIDDTVFTPATSAVTPAGATYRAVRDLVDNNDIGALAMTQRRALLAALETPGGVTVMDAVNTAVRVNMVAGGGAGGTSMADDAAFTPGATQVTPVAGFADEVAPDSVNEGDAGVVRMSLNRNLYIVLRDAAGNERGLNVDAANTIGINDGGGNISVDDGGGSLSVDDAGGSLTIDNAALSVVGGGAEATALRVTIANDSTGLVSVDDNGGSLTVDNAALSVVGGGAEATALRVTIANDSTGVLTVDNTVLSVVGGGTEATAQRVTIANDSTGVLTVDDGGASLTVDNAALSVVGGGAEATALRVTIANDSTGVLTVDDGGGSLTIDGTVTAANTAGDVADDAVDSGNPVKIGGVAVETDGTDPTSVSAEGDRAEVRTDRNRRLLVNTGHPNGFSNNNNYAAAQTDTAIQAAPGANLSLYITDIVLSTEGACSIQLVRNTAASVTIYGPFYFAANGGLVKEFKTPLRLPTNENLGVTSSAAVNHTISIQGYTAP